MSYTDPKVWAGTRTRVTRFLWKSLVVSQRSRYSDFLTKDYHHPKAATRRRGARVS